MGGILAFTVQLFAGELPIVYLDHVVAIGRKETKPGPDQGKWFGEATGFIYGEFAGNSPAGRQYTPFLVTNRHVIEEHIALTDGAALFVRFNPKAEGPATDYDLPLTIGGHPTWHAHPDPEVDLAVVTLNASWLQTAGVSFGFFRNDLDTLGRSKAKDLGLSEGNGIFVLGFPMSLVGQQLVGQQRDYVVVRQGCIARITDSLNAPSRIKTFLVDAFVFPGNSGGPVVLRPNPPEAQFQGEKAPINAAYLIGVVRGYQPYIDVAISPQTKRPRVSFEENSGLAEVVPADYIDETIADSMVNPDKAEAK